MLKQTVTYDGFDDVERTEELYFNLTKTDLVDHLNLVERFEKMEQTFSGPERELTPAEVKDILNLVQFFIQLSYGERSEDGRRFVKTPQVWEDFRYGAAYDAFLWSLFEQPENAIAFMIGVLPKDLREQATATAREKLPEAFESFEKPKDQSVAEAQTRLYTESVDAVDISGPVLEAPEDNRPAWEKENREPTVKEIREMSADELQYAFKARATRK